ncbi:MAG: hypothetical protein E6K72_05580 [Candidatus Eisenbacteria bacterium]|uniref:Uncharacterized protein n=1 Tax=Eiseniibacteriota bacterium TaxID=2212470 RepID=A0A538SXT4_UNCEI|nr:MAG: hypothetical protein E6K72_05580 [Candidatus Eisenbacteria bacterium]
MEPPRPSRQQTMAPPAPSGTSWGLSWAPSAVQSATPSTVHSGAPAAFTRRAKMSALLPRRSSHATMAPPAPSGVMRGNRWTPVAAHSATPSTVHRDAPVPSTRWT